MPCDPNPWVAALPDRAIVTRVADLLRGEDPALRVAETLLK